MNKTTDYSIQELSTALLEDYLAFFDHDAFADNPRWASCYCHFPHAPHDLKNWSERAADENRTAVTDLIRQQRMQGYLAYLDGKPVGWCNAGLPAQMTILPAGDNPQIDRIGSIVCFVVAKSHRGKGIARRLLEAACAGFRQQGLEIAEAYPRKDVQDEASNHYGPLAMYLDTGFKPFRETNDNVIVRKILV